MSETPKGILRYLYCGSKLICSSPQLIAACHVLRRLPMPRHSPYALLRLNYFLYIWRYTIGSRLSRLNCCVSYLQFKTFYRLWQNCFFYPLRKNLISFCRSYSAVYDFQFPFTLSVMYVTFILLKNQYVISLIRFSMSILFKPNLFSC